MRGLLRQLGRFFTVGMVATGVHVAAALYLNGPGGLSPLSANIGAFCVAFAFSYAGNYVYTFEAMADHRQSVPRFLIVSLVGLALNQSIVWLCVEKLGWAFWQSMLPVAVMVPALGYVMSRMWAFRPANSAAS